MPERRRWDARAVRAGAVSVSSTISSACGHRDGPKPLHVRTWACSEPTCGTVHDLDWNAGRNVGYEGRRILAASTTAPPTPGPGARRR
ncbi:zinc ribbon domain-containing protein [Streptomyces sp. PT12]|uniref:zinc ribbon domain-containing protein n=1 Tax=Streptomyces sp. PT12 TaxID=1510197 RepID=UPI0028528884|nr:zinc ribbon domain-containing protein [Streptomyces sp. PT12]